jgi:hypothetical protein
VIIPCGVPAIVSDELFNQVQERMEKNKRAPSRTRAEDEYLCTYNYKDRTETISLADIEAALGSDLGGGCPPCQPIALQCVDAVFAT